MSQRMIRWGYIVFMVMLVGWSAKWVLGDKVTSYHNTLSQEKEWGALHFQLDQEVIGKKAALIRGKLSKIDGSIFTTPLLQNYKNEVIKVNEKVDAEDNTILIKEIEFEPLYVSIRGVQNQKGKKFAMREDGYVALEMQGGEVVPLRKSDINNLYEEQFEYEFTPVKEEGIDGIDMPRLLQPANVEVLVVGGQRMLLR
ncbi:MAG: hypothetical protein ACRCTE_02385 [Cellulosilyticaceae bacterium]